MLAPAPHTAPAAVEDAVSLGDVADVVSDIKRASADQIAQIQRIMSQMRMLALNAKIESARAGDMGRGFAVVANEVHSVGDVVGEIARNFEAELTQRIGGLERLVTAMADQAQGERLVDLSLNAIELIDRNLYERTCDVRWWATDPAIVDCATEPTAERSAYACERLGVILGAYTVYLDLWLCGPDGRILANGRPDRYRVIGENVSSAPWFRDARALASGDAYVAADIAVEPRLRDAQVATFAATVGGGKGVLAVHFDWAPQAGAIVGGVRVGAEARERTRVLLVDARGRVIAASDGDASLRETVSLAAAGRRSGYDRKADGTVVAFHESPGYETYRGLGWYGVIVERAAGDTAQG